MWYQGTRTRSNTADRAGGGVRGTPSKLCHGYTVGQGWIRLLSCFACTNRRLGTCVWLYWSPECLLRSTSHWQTHFSPSIPPQIPKFTYSTQDPQDTASDQHSSDSIPSPLPPLHSTPNKAGSDHTCTNHPHVMNAHFFPPMQVSEQNHAPAPEHCTLLLTITPILTSGKQTRKKLRGTKLDDCCPPCKRIYLSSFLQGICTEL